jgi:uncharacterized protein (DUF433 family)
MSTTHTTNTESTRGQIGQGIYSLADLRLYVAYFGEPSDGPHALRWLTDALNPAGHRARQPDYSFTDLVSLFVVRELIRFGVKVSAIREAEASMRLTRGVDRPLACEDIATDGREVFFATEPNQVESANRTSRRQRAGQQASAIAIAPYLHRVRYHEGAAAMWSPVDGIVLNPLVQFGEPVIDGTRVLTSAVADLARAEGVDVAANWLDVDRDAANTAVRFERQLAALRN